MPSVIDTRVICKQPGRYIGWPTVGGAPDGVLYALFSGDRDGHVGPFGKNFLIRSEDEGQSWSAPALVNDTPMDDRDTGLCIHPDGTLIMSWFTSFYYGRYSLRYHDERQRKRAWSFRPTEAWAAKLQAVTPEIARQWGPLLRKAGPSESAQPLRAAGESGFPLWFEGEDRRYPPGTLRLGYWTRRSTDGGRTWDEPAPSPVSAPHGPNLLSNGDLIYVGSMHQRATDDGVRLGAAVSSDKGVTWRLCAAVNGSPENLDWEALGQAATLCEPHVVVAPSGKLVALARCLGNNALGRLWQFDSTDAGQTWTEPRETNLNGFPPHLLRLRDGRLMVSYALRHAPYGQRYCFSPDEGATWDIAQQLACTEAPNGDQGYPSSVELPDGTILSVYYQRERIDEKPCLMQTRWHL